MGTNYSRLSALFFFFLSINFTHAQLILNWANSYESQYGNYSSDIVVNDSLNVYTIGKYSDSTNFQTGSGDLYLVPQGSWDVYVTKKDSSGNLVWAVSLGGYGSDDGFGIAVDNDGYVYATGYFHGVADFNPGSDTLYLEALGAQDVYIVKLTPNGELVWAKSFGGTSFDVGFDIEVDNNGYLYVLGTFYDTADFDPSVGTFNMTSNGNSDIFINKLDTAGNFVWAKQIGGWGGDMPNRIILDNNYNLITVGYFNGTSDFDPGSSSYNLTSNNGSGESFISKLDSAGNFIFAKSFESTSYNYIADVSVDNNGNIYTTGRFTGVIDFDPSPSLYLDSTNHYAYSGSFIHRLDSLGNFSWVKTFSGDSPTIGQALCADTSGAIYAIGTFGSSIDFDPGTNTYNLTPNGSRDMYILHLDSNGEFEWSQQIGDNWKVDGRRILITDNTDLFISGWFDGGAGISGGTVDFDPGLNDWVLVNQEGDNTFTLRFKLQNEPSLNVEGGFQDLYANQIYPNPTRDVLNINTEYTNGFGLLIYDSNYRLITKTNTNSNFHRIDVSDYPKGIYLIRIESDFSVSYKKFVIK